MPGAQASPPGAIWRLLLCPARTVLGCSTNAGKPVITVNVTRARKGEVEKRKGSPHQEGAFELHNELDECSFLPPDSSEDSLRENLPCEGSPFGVPGPCEGPG